MRAVFQYIYGKPEFLKVEDVKKPEPGKKDILVKLLATSINGSDIEFLLGKPGYVRMFGPFKPRKRILGSDIAGIVVAVGSDVKNFAPGDAVFGDNMEGKSGLAQYVCVPEKKLIHKPESITFEEAAAIPQGSTVALQGLRDKGKLKSGEKVLINGAGGSVGCFAIQLAKMYGAKVTAVDVGSKQNWMSKLGADHVIDYKATDFTKNGKKYDLIFDLVAYRSIFDYKRSLSKNGRYVVVGGALSRILQALFLGFWTALTSKKRMGILAHIQNEKDIKHMVKLHSQERVRAIVDKTFPLVKTSEAFDYVISGGSKGKVLILPDR